MAQTAETNEPKKTIAIIGLGYVNEPLAVELCKVRPVIGLDINPQRIAELQARQDHTLGYSHDKMEQATNLR